ncbi:Uu.00g067690.m01.CDS01 [Anthostomella pinea]|uniref:Uu.00g067690.m01.CDS01 n=1 Tax=Anthostomella pinea TaxID=933095 RepID=A0AAI8VV00_9PEZI|nr:Uu.00g067690.m01.CDS01 [Anthostomella pinea]
MTWCFPCVTFGKTYHRLHKSGILTDTILRIDRYLPLAPLRLLLRRSPLNPHLDAASEYAREVQLLGYLSRYIALSFRYGCCSHVQQEREAAHREPMPSAGGDAQKCN